jgi:hypothetical protein
MEKFSEEQERLLKEAGYERSVDRGYNVDYFGKKTELAETQFHFDGRNYFSIVIKNVEKVSQINNLKKEYLEFSKLRKAFFDAEEKEDGKLRSWKGFVVVCKMTWADGSPAVTGDDTKGSEHLLYATPMSRGDMKSFRLVGVRFASEVLMTKAEAERVKSLVGCLYSINTDGGRTLSYSLREAIAWGATWKFVEEMTESDYAEAGIAKPKE